MVKFVTKDIAAYAPEQKEKLRKVIAAVSAEAQLPSQLAADQRDAALIEEGRALIQSDTKCTDCHQFRKPDEEASAPNLTGYASRQWLTNFISNPAHADFYGKRNDRMPAFGAQQILSPQTIGLIADWLRGDWYEARGEVKSVK
jgi:ubiquinol-cytochrome c reductase cytochrome b subunit